jgi:putative ABC transport system substrate-binding protein
VIVGGLAIAASARTRASTMPRIGFLRSTPAAPFTHIVDAFRAGLRDIGLIENENVAVEYRWADNRLDRLPALAGELVRRPVSVIVGNGVAAEAAKQATSSIPIVFVTSDDPVARGLVDNLRRPTGNATGITFFGGGSLGAKRLELLQELVPTAKVIAFLIDPKSPASGGELAETQALAATQGRIVVAVRRRASAKSSRRSPRCARPTPRRSSSEEARSTRATAARSAAWRRAMRCRRSTTCASTSPTAD